MDYRALPAVSRQQALALLFAATRSSPSPDLRHACHELLRAVGIGDELAASAAAFELTRIAHSLPLPEAEKDLWSAIGLRWQLYA